MAELAKPGSTETASCAQDSKAMMLSLGVLQIKCFYWEKQCYLTYCIGLTQKKLQDGPQGWDATSPPTRGMHRCTLATHLGERLCCKSAYTHLGSNPGRFATASHDHSRRILTRQVPPVHIGKRNGPIRGPYRPPAGSLTQLLAR